jgi:hypothetical protein
VPYTAQPGREARNFTLNLVPRITPMVTKRTPKPGKKRYRRTPEEQIADLQKEIERLKRRAKAKKAKQSPEIKNVVAAVRLLTKALDGAQDAALKKAASEAKDTLTAYLELEGVPVPKKRGPRRKKAAA